MMIVLAPAVSYIAGGRRVRAAALVSTLAHKAGRDELLAFAARFRISARRLRNRYTVFEHFSLRGGAIEQAAAAGAARVNRERLREIIDAKWNGKARQRPEAFHADKIAA